MDGLIVMGMAEGEMTPIFDASPLCRLSAAELRDAYRLSRLTPVEVAPVALDRAEVVQHRFNSFSRTDRAAALTAAIASEDRWRRGAPLSPIDGVTGTIKDIVWVENWPSGTAAPRCRPNRAWPSRGSGRRG